ncbi:hypothetical protein [Bacillus atrophaeus]|uniref:hypothetical protein n=1 Tax=Bacillus atrophaeus TaxID=1452 RepID=UPI00255BEAD5|nr:hypothetical protein [Bacillus atrophaeus]MDL5143642.1 hypothetical protein [Bacillus atrophaeus]
MNWFLGLNWGIQWGTVFTVLGTLTAAFLGQVFSHRYSQKREELKLKKESFQNLYSPVVFKVIKYLELECNKHNHIALTNISELEYDEKNQDNEAFTPVCNSMSFLRLLVRT